MADGSSSDDDELELDDLEGLRLELEALRQELGDGFVAVSDIVGATTAAGTAILAPAGLQGAPCVA